MPLKNWKLKPQVPEEITAKTLANPIAQGKGDLKLLAQLLFNRGLTEEQEINNFLSPKYEDLHDPFKFLDMQKAVDRIWLAVENKEKICVYGDYDADAVTANAVLQQTFKYLGANTESYIPDRFSEGYGVNLEALEKIKQSGAKIIVTVDCGTNSTDAAEFCKENDIDFIITDHHEIIGDSPKAFALINPKNSNDNYPFHEITGVGVAFKLASALLNRGKGLEVRGKGWEKWLLDLVAIGTVADCHSLLGENRILVKYGLRVLAKTKWIGLKALMQAASVDPAKPLDTYTLGFQIAPRLNAAGRLEHADIALDLLLEDNPAMAVKRSAELETINQRRQQLTGQVLSEAKGQALILQERKILALVGEGWPKGVMGLVAGRLAEEYYKPVIVLERTEGVCTGSARTAGDFDIIEALKFSSEHLVKFGGHKQAAGLTLEFSKFEMFYQKLLDFADQNIDVENNQKTLELEAELSESDLSLATCNLLLSFEPFGVGNQRPKFLIKQMKISSVRAVGATKQHLQLQLQKDSKTVSAIAFNFSFLEKNLIVGNTVDVAAELTEDNWNGNSNLKLRIVDIKAL